MSPFQHSILSHNCQLAPLPSSLTLSTFLPMASLSTFHNFPLISTNWPDHQKSTLIFFPAALPYKMVIFTCFNYSNYLFFLFFFSSVKSVSGPNASTATLKYGPNILIAHGTTKGGGGAPDPLVVKNY